MIKRPTKRGFAPPRKQIEARFFQLASGAEPVRDFLKKDLGKDDCQILGQDIATVEFGWPLGMPICKPIGRGLYEVRSTISGPREVRVLFTIKGGTMVLLHAFIKKTRRTPQREIDLARKRQGDV